MTPRTARREFLRFLAGSPLLSRAWAQAPTLKLESAKDAVALMDFEEAAHKLLPPAHWGYLASGVDDDATLRANRAGFQKFQLRPHRLAGVSAPDVKTEVFGQTWELPSSCAPWVARRCFIRRAK